MTDRKLLELAAKAAGMKIEPHVNAKHVRDLHFMHKGRNWNPLTDDGDALRLAITVALDIFCDCDGAVVVEFDAGNKQLSERIREDRYAATRRAIVRAAAEIGRAME